MEKDRLIEVIKEFDKRKIAVVGDIALDRYSWVRPMPENPESEAPLYTEVCSEDRIGCAGNVAANISSLGAKTYLCGLVGKDSEGKIIRKICLDKGISYYLFEEGKTNVKERIIGIEHGTYLGRIDRNDRNSLHDLQPINQEGEDFMYDRLINEKLDSIVLSDYNKRVFRNNLARRIIKYANEQNIITIVDPKQQNIASFTGATLIKPNKKEARKIAGQEHLIEESALAKKIKEITMSKFILITLGKDGMIAYENEVNHIRAQDIDVYDVCGAGDTVSAVLALSLSSGATLLESAHIANYAAGIVVEKQGTSTLTSEELINRIKQS